MDPLLAYSMPPDVQVVDSLRIIALPHINGDVSEILANEVEEFYDYLEQHGGTATPPKLLRSSPLFRIPQKIEGMAGSDQPAVKGGSQGLIESHVAKDLFQESICVNCFN